MTLSKAFVAGLACAVGVCAFAAVEGNNTAVVIRKAPVVSDNGYQFLCVPVRGFDITGQGQAEAVALGDIIPASAYAAGTELIVEGNAESSEVGDTGLLANGNYKCTAGTSGNTWTLAGSGDDVSASLVKNAARLWLKVAVTPVTPANGGLTGLLAAKQAATATDATYPETIFAGEGVPTLAEDQYLLTSVTPGTMLACGNNTSEPIDIRTQLVAELQDRDQILRVQEGSDEYCYIIPRVRTINGQKQVRWQVAGQLSATEDATFQIAPGEAFYFYRQPAAQ